MTTSAKCPPPDSRTPEPPELDRRVERVDRAPGRILRVDRGLIHEHVDVASEQAHRSRDDESRDEERGHRVPSGKPERRRGQPGEHGKRPGEVAPEMERVREQRVAPVAPRGAQRDRGTRRVDRDHESDRREGPPGRLDLELDRRRRGARSRAPAMTTLTRTRKAASASAARCCGLPVSPRVARVRRPHGDRDREEREQRGGEVGPRVRRLREEPEAPAREPCDELDRDQEAGGPTETSAVRRCGDMRGRLRRQLVAA